MTAKIYRFNFSPEFIAELEYFAKIHKYEDKNGFKEKWTEWVEENKELIDAEKERLEELNYDGDIDNKMYTSARYYFRKKKEEKVEPKKRKVYVPISKEILGIIDEHISENYDNSGYTQQNGFEDFYEENEDLLEYDIILSSKENLKDKIKKTYKNRYYIFIKKLKQQCYEEE